MSEGGNVVDFNKGQRTLSVAKGLTRRRDPECRCLNTVITAPPEPSRLFCADCGETLNPWELLLTLARQEDQDRRRDAASNHLAAALAWLYEKDGRLSYSRKGGLRVSVEIAGKRHSRRCGDFASRSHVVGLVRGIAELVPWREKRPGCPEWMTFV